MAIPQLSKLMPGVRFPSPAHPLKKIFDFLRELVEDRP